MIGGRNRHTGECVFPLPKGSSGQDFAPCELPAEGELWAFTIQRIPPKNPPYVGLNDPETFRPYAVGYVKLGNSVMVEGRLAVPLDALHPGIKMRCTVIDIDKPDGGVFQTFAFKAANEVAP